MSLDEPINSDEGNSDTMISCLPSSTDASSDWHVRYDDTLNDPEDYECDFMREGLRSGTHPLIQCGYIEHKCNDGQADMEQYMLTRKAKAELLSAYIPRHSKCRRTRPRDRFLKRHTSIKEKSLFFKTSTASSLPPPT